MAEIDDSALLKALAAAGHGIVAAPLEVQDELEQLYGLELVGALSVREAWFALTLQQRLDHPGVQAMLGEVPAAGRLQPAPQTAPGAVHGGEEAGRKAGRGGAARRAHRSPGRRG